MVEDNGLKYSSLENYKMMEETLMTMSAEQHNTVSDISLHTLENYSTELFSDEDLTEVLTINSTYPTHGPMETLFGESGWLIGRH